MNTISIMTAGGKATAAGIKQVQLLEITPLYFIVDDGQGRLRVPWQHVAREDLIKSLNENYQAQTSDRRGF